MYATPLQSSKAHIESRVQDVLHKALRLTCLVGRQHCKQKGRATGLPAWGRGTQNSPPGVGSPAGRPTDGMVQLQPGSSGRAKCAAVQQCGTPSSTLVDCTATCVAMACNSLETATPSPRSTHLTARGSPARRPHPRIARPRTRRARAGAASTGHQTRSCCSGRRGSSGGAQAAQQHRAELPLLLCLSATCRATAQQACPANSSNALTPLIPTQQTSLPPPLPGQATGKGTLGVNPTHSSHPSQQVSSPLVLQVQNQRQLAGGGGDGRHKVGQRQVHQELCNGCNGRQVMG